MGKTKRTDEVMNRLVDWVRELKFDPVKQVWIGSVKPAGIIETLSYESWVTMLEQHACKEIILLVTEVLNIPYEQFQDKRRFQGVADAKMVASIIINDHFREVRIHNIVKLFGWVNHCSFIHAVKQEEVNVIQKKLEKVYRAYPDLRHGRVDIS